ncbi:MAG: NlpC/P60 family protein [Aristaeellaceae bacterium]
MCDHTGIYLGSNMFIHASSGAGKVIVSDLSSGYYNRVFSWGRRVLNT